MSSPQTPCWKVGVLLVFAVLTPLCAHAESTVIQPLKKDDAKALLNQVTILSDRGHWTTVTKGSVIHVPVRLEHKISTSPKGKYLPFRKFLSKNSIWLHGYPISYDLCFGKKKLDEHSWERIQQIPKIVITTSRSKQPLSIHSDSIPKEDDTSSIVNNQSPKDQ